MLPDLSTDMRWRKSSFSGGEGGECVELANVGDAVRDSKNPDGPRLRGAADLIAAVQAGSLTR